MGFEINNIFVVKEKYTVEELFEKTKSEISASTLDVANTFMDVVKKTTFDEKSIEKKYHVVYHLKYRAKIDSKLQDGSTKTFEVSHEFDSEENSCPFIEDDLSKYQENDLEPFNPQDSNSSTYDEKKIKLLIMKHLMDCKDYKEAKKGLEIWSEILEQEVVVFYLPYVVFQIGKKTQYANLITGEVKIDYQLSKEITSIALNIKLMRYPVLIFNIVLIAAYFFMSFLFQNNGREINSAFLVFIIIFAVISIGLTIYGGGKKITRQYIVKDIESGNEPQLLHRKIFYLQLVVSTLLLIELAIFYLLYH